MAGIKRNSRQKKQQKNSIRMLSFFLCTDKGRASRLSYIDRRYEILPTANHCTEDYDNLTRPRQGERCSYTSIYKCIIGLLHEGEFSVPLPRAPITQRGVSIRQTERRNVLLSLVLHLWCVYCFRLFTS